MKVDAVDTSFTAFVKLSGRSLRQALIAAYGPDTGCEVTADALAYGWEHWERVGSMENPAGYLYRVGQTRARRGIFRGPPLFDTPESTDRALWFEPALPKAIASLPERQRAAVVLVHGYGWTVAEVADMWDLSFSTVHAHVTRGVEKLRKRLGVDDA